MKNVVKVIILAVAFISFGCSKDNNGASVVGTPTTQCMSSIPTGPGGQVGGYPQQYPYNNYNNNCFYGYGSNPYFMPYTYGWNNGFACPSRFIAAYSASLGLSCVATYGIPFNNLMYYSYYNGWTNNAYYMNYSAYAWNSYYTAVSCVSSYPGCNCIPTGNGTSGIGICTR